MNKAEVVSKVAEEAKITKAAADKAFQAVIGCVQGALTNGEKVCFVGFGTFSVSERKARKGRNPQTGKEIKIPDKKVPKFTAGASLKEAVSAKAKKLDYSTLMKRRGAYSNEMLSEVRLPIFYKYKRIPRKNEVICKYNEFNGSMSLGITHHLVFPYKERTFWSIWITMRDYHADFIDQRISAYPAGWVESRKGDCPKNIAKFLLINSLSMHCALERVGTPSEVPLGIIGEVEPGILGTNEILSSMFSIFSEIEVFEEYEWKAFNSSGLEDAILDSTFPEYKKVVVNKIYK